jgi:hypothetical protein
MAVWSRIGTSNAKHLEHGRRALPSPVNRSSAAPPQSTAPPRSLPRCWLLTYGRAHSAVYNYMHGWFIRVWKTFPIDLYSIANLEPSSGGASKHLIGECAFAVYVAVYLPRTSTVVYRIITPLPPASPSGFYLVYCLFTTPSPSQLHHYFFPPFPLPHCLLSACKIVRV